MSDQKDRNRKLMMLGGLGLGLAMLGRKRRWRRYAMGQMMGGGYGGGRWGRFGGYGYGGPGGPGFTLPPFIEANLKAWHDRAHGTVPPPGTATDQPGQMFTLPPFIEANLKAWHDRAHGTVPPAGTGASQSETAQV